jgi:hypothetical protein
MIMTAEFWKSAGETAIKAAAAAALGVIGADQFITAMSVDWTQVGGVALLAGIVSILTAIVAPNPDIRAAKREAVRLEAEAKAAAEKKAAAAAKRKANAANK